MIFTIIGANGSMGKRYQAILKYLGHASFNVDIDARFSGAVEAVYHSHGIIIATPTEKHLDYIRLFAAMGKPILCEKPLSKNKAELEEIRTLVKAHGTKLAMTMQYLTLTTPDATGPSYYNYFKTGNDGLYWDCLQIIALAKDEVTVDNTSPIWECQINGERLSISGMDHAYIEFVRSWIKGEVNFDIDDLIGFHDKVQKFAEAKHG